MVEKNYGAAGRSYFAAQQAEGFSGSANLRMAAALMGMERYTDGVSYIQFYVQAKGKIPAGAFSMPEDPAMEQRIETRLAQAPHHNDLLITAAVYSIAREDRERAGKYLKTLRAVNSHHPCLAFLEEAADRVSQSKRDLNDKDQ